MTEYDTDHVRATYPRLLRFGDLAPQPLHAGKGTLREVWTAAGPGLELRWQLQLVELKGPMGVLTAPADTHQLVVGLGGPQVSIGQVALRRDRALAVRAATVEFRRPRLRVTGASSMLVLTYPAASEPPVFTFLDLDGPASFPVGTHMLVALQGALRLAAFDVPRQSVVILDAERAFEGDTTSAHILAMTDVSQDATKTRDAAGAD